MKKRSSPGILMAVCLMGVMLHCQSLPGQEVALSANVADCLSLGTLNASASYGVAKHWSLEAQCKYNPFSWEIPGAEGDLVQQKQRTASLGARFWPWHIFSGWWMSARAQWQEYSSSPFSDPQAVEGDRMGLAGAVGYTYMLSRHFNLEFGAGLWSGYGTAVRYACPRCGREVSRGTGWFIRPSDYILAVSYVF